MINKYIWINVTIAIYLCLSSPTLKASTKYSLGWTVQKIFALTSGKPIERDMSGGESHSYQISIQAGQYLHAFVDQKGIDVVITVLSPDGHKLTEADNSSGAIGPESISVIAAATGIYRIDIHSFEKTAKTGRYEIWIEGPREPTPEDKYRSEAGSAIGEANRLQNGATEDKRRSVEKYNVALDLYRRINDRRGEADALKNLGIVHQSLGETQKALEKYKEALPVKQAIGDQGGMAEILNNLGVIYRTLGELRNAVEMFSEALVIRRALGQRDGEAMALNNIGLAYWSLGEIPKAFENLNEALLIRRSIGDQRSVAYTLNSIGLVYRLIGETQKALEMYYEALSVFRGVNDRSNVAVTLHNLGVAYASLGEVHKALEFYRESLSIKQTIGDRSGEARTLNGIGGAYGLLGDTQKALEKYNEALLIRKSLGDRVGEASTLDNIGAVYSSLGKMQQALETYNDSLLICRKIGDRRGEAYALNHIGRTYLKLGDTQQALGKYSEALVLRRTIGDRRGEAITLGGIARAEEKRGNLNQARLFIEGALNIIESLRTKVGGQELRASYMASQQEYYECYIDILMALYHENPSAALAGEALAISERARARSLLELLAEVRTNISRGIDASLLMRGRLIEQQLNAKAEAQISLLNRQHTSTQAEAIEKEIATLIAEYNRLEAQVRSQNPLYAGLTLPQPLNLKQIQQQLLDEDTLLLEYALGEKQSYLWLVSRHSIETFNLPSRIEIESAVHEFYKMVTAETRRGAPPDPKMILKAQVLSKMLIKPAASRLAGKRLVIVAPGSLAYLPFAALPKPNTEKTVEGNYQPLTARHEVVMIPSASVLSQIRSERPGRQPVSQSIAVVADPVFEANDPRLGSTKNRNSSRVIPSIMASAEENSELTRSIQTMNFPNNRNGFTRLPFSHQEAESIFALVPRGTGLKATDFNASRSLVKSGQLSKYRILHFATHGLLNNQHPELSGLVFSLVDRKGGSQDGFLRLHEIYNLELNADLVVLSACETGLGKEVKGEGLIGLTRGFMYAGVPSIVASLWKVDDFATAELMKRFYRGMLKENLTPSAALRKAQIELSQQRGWSSPYFWSGFVLHGEWQ